MHSRRSKVQSTASAGDVGDNYVTSEQTTRKTEIESLHHCKFIR